MSNYDSYRGPGQQQYGNTYQPQQQFDPPTGYGQYSGNPYEQVTQPTVRPTQTEGSSYYTNPTPQRTQEQVPYGGAGYGGQPQQQNIEMTNINGGRGTGNDPNQILNECRAIERAADEIENGDLAELQQLQPRYLQSTQAEPEMEARIEELNTRVKRNYQNLIARVRRIKENPLSREPRNAPSVGKVDRRLKTSLNKAQQMERNHRQQAREYFERQYRIVRPDASEAEVREAEESNTQVFSQALMSSDRRGQATTTRSTVQRRHEDIQKIEQQMVQLAQLFQDLETMVVQQEPAIDNTEQKATEVNEHVSKANVELGGAVKKARAARRKKWICLGIAVLIIIIIIVVVVVVVEVTKH